MTRLLAPLRVGTKSVLYGAHAFWLHPWFVALGWWKLYGFPWDPRLWVAFFVHDLGYFGKPNMDGPEGEEHPWFGATVMHFFDGCCETKWLDFALYHSRFYAKKYGAQPSRLCIADKLSICLTPWWLYLPMVRATGEIHEYRKLATKGDANKYASMNTWADDEKEWYLNVQDYLRKWVAEHKDGRPDTWTPNVRQANDDSGVWS